MPPSPAPWLTLRPEGLYCAPADLFIDPQRVVERAVITHAHSDHARPGHRHVLASPETLLLMRARLGARACASPQSLGWGETVAIGGVRLSLAPAGHVLGSAQVVLEHAGQRVVISGDYKRAADPTCAGFVPAPCDVFITEATFGLPVFRFPPAAREITRLLDSLALFPDRTHVLGCYSLGKSQRVIALLREAGWDRTIFVHGALAGMCAVYEACGVRLGPLRPASEARTAALAGAIVLAPPGTTTEGWAGQPTDPVGALASGWMATRRHARARGMEMPLVISDHADWDALIATIAETGAAEVWVTHGREDALIHAAARLGVRARALRAASAEVAADPAAEPATGR